MKYLDNKFDEIRDLLSESNAQKAFSILTTILYYPGKVSTDKEWKIALLLFNEISKQVVGEKLSALVKKAAADPLNIQTLYDLAYELYEQKLNGIGATVLKRANEISPGNKSIITELVSNLEVIMRNDEACRIMEKETELVENDSMVRYLLAFNYLMTGSIDKTRKILLTINNVEDGNIEYMINALKGMLERLDILKSASKLDEYDLRGWHMVLNGSLLLHLSPYGFDEGMNGRYAYTNDSYSKCLEGIKRVGKVLEISKIDIPCIYHLPSRSSRILALAAGQYLNKPVKEWPKTGTDEPGLIILYDQFEIKNREIYDQLRTHNPDQILWSHASSWTDPYPFSPDITTFLYQLNLSPWDGGIRVDPNTQKVINAEGDSSPDEVLAEKILTAEKDEMFYDDLDKIITLIKTIKDLKEEHAAGIFRIQGHRYHQRNGSPVKSNMFI